MQVRVLQVLQDKEIVSVIPDAMLEHIDLANELFRNGFLNKKQSDGAEVTPNEEYNKEFGPSHLMFTVEVDDERILVTATLTEMK